MVYLFIFLAELISLFFFSRLLTNSIARLFFTITRSHKTTISLLAVLYLPGTIIHELAHVIVAGALLVQSGEIEFMPQVRDDGIKLGSAEIEKTDPFRRAIIGLAPVLVGSASILGLIYYLNRLFSQNSASILAFIIIFILIFMLSNTMFSSKKDLEGTVSVLILILSFIIGIYLLGFGSAFNWVGELYERHYRETFKLASVFMLVPIGIDLAAYLLIRLTLGRIRKYS